VEEERRNREEKTNPWEIQIPGAGQVVGCSIWEGGKCACLYLGKCEYRLEKEKDSKEEPCSVFLFFLFFFFFKRAGRLECRPTSPKHFINPVSRAHKIDNLSHRVLYII
jgi:hypothetical protein